MKNPLAFPNEKYEPGTVGYEEESGGMTLLDYFAGQVIQGSIINYQDEKTWIAKRAYEIAQAMLEEREKYIK